MTLLFIHGAGGGSTTWQLQLKHFKDALAIELPGHPRGFGYSTIEEYTQFVERYVATNHVNQPILVGHSMGGAIAIEYALRNTGPVGLVLVGTGARLRVRQDIFDMIRDDYREATQMLAKLSVAPCSDPLIVERIRDELFKVKPEVVYGDFSACNKFDRMNDVQRISCPVLVLCGAEDQLTPIQYSEYLHQKIENSRLVVVPGAGHSIMLEIHREFNSALQDFVRSLAQ